MNHSDHVALLRNGIPAPGGVWADLGAGAGAFTWALADLLGPGATIYAVDQDMGALLENRRGLQMRWPGTLAHIQQGDFTRPLDLPPLDGVVMANALHFVRQKEPVLARVHSLLRPGGRLLLVEYSADSGNPWVPFPLSYPRWAALAVRCGFSSTRLLTTVPSRFLREIYAAASDRPPAAV